MGLVLHLHKKLLIIALLVGASSVYAQTITPQQNRAITTTASPARVSEELQSSTQIPQAKPSALNTSEQKKSPGIEGADKIKFHLNGFVLEGNTVYSTQTLLALFHKPIPSDISLADIEKFVDQISLKYRNDGYILSRAIIPEQKIQGGVVQLKIIEGFVDKVVVRGKTKATPLLEKYGAKISQSKPLRLEVLERYALLSNDIPGLAVQTVLSPSKTVQGAADLTMIVTEQRVQPYLSVDNRGTIFLGPTQYSAGVNLNNMVTSGGSIGARTVISGGASHELRFGELTDTEAVGSSGGRIYLAATQTNTTPGASLAEIDVQGESKTGSVNYQYPLIRSRRKNFYIHTAFYYLNSLTNALDEELYNDRTRSINIGTSYDYSDSYNGVNTLTTDFFQGLKVLNQSPSDSPYLSQPNGKTDFSKLNFEATRQQWFTAKFSALVGVRGQYSFSQLLSPQQFGVGGSDYGRAYDPSSITGDQGIAGKVALRYDTYPEFWWVQTIRYYVFYDIGAVWLIDHSAEDANARTSLASTGIGAQMNFSSVFAGYIELDKPLTYPVVNEHNHRAPRIFFGLYANF